MTTPLARYVAPGMARPGLWRLFLGILLIVIGWLLWTVLVMSGFVLWRLGAGDQVPVALEAMQAFLGAHTPSSVIFQLSTFAGIWPAAWVTLRLLHRQRLGTLISPEGRMRWGEFGGGAMIAIGFWVVTITIGGAIVGAPVRTDLPLASWAAAMLPLAVLVFFQASAEELVFRGYMLQQLAGRWRSPVIWAALPGFLFGLAHYSNGSEIGVGLHYVAVTTLFGLAAAALVWRTGSLAAAMGLHTAMNMFSLSGVGLKGVIEGTQLYLYDASLAKVLFTADGISTLAILLFILSPLCPLRNREAAA